MTSRTEYNTQTPNKTSLFDVQYLRNHRTLDIGVLGYIGIVWPKEHSPEVRSFPPGTPCMCLFWRYCKRGRRGYISSLASPINKTNFPYFSQIWQSAGHSASYKIWKNSPALLLSTHSPIHAFIYVQSVNIFIIKPVIQLFITHPYGYSFIHWHAYPKISCWLSPSAAFL